MAYIPVPKDLSRIKNKVAFNLTKRQLICLGGGALIGVPLFFLTKDVLGSTAAAMIMIIIMLPAFLFGLYERDGQPLEQYLKQMILVLYKRPKQRPYQSRNIYSAIIAQDEYNREVHRILRGNKKAKKAN